jgi:phage virion morphogenesis protein
MGGITLDVSVDDKQVRDLFAKIERRGDSPRPALKSIGEYMIRRTFERFSAEKDPEGIPWLPLSEATLKRKKPGLKILQGDTNLLRDEINYRVDSSSVGIGTALIYGAIHQLGGKAGRGHKVTIPARPYLGVNDEDLREFALILSDYLTEG